MKLVMVPAALEELQSAAAFYATSANLELVRAFIAEFERTSNLLLENPHIGNLFRGTDAAMHCAGFLTISFISSLLMNYA